MLLSTDRIKLIMGITGQSVIIGVDTFTISVTPLDYGINDQLPLEPTRAWAFIKSEAAPAPGTLIIRDGETSLVIGSRTAPDDTTYRAFVYVLPSEVTYTPVTPNEFNKFGKKIIDAGLNETLKARVDSGVIADDLESELLPVQSFIIPNPVTLPSSGCKITFGGKSYDIDNIKEVTAASGEVIGWRLIV
jgi:hypothetical protein